MTDKVQVKKEEIKKKDEPKKEEEKKEDPKKDEEKKEEIKEIKMMQTMHKGDYQVHILIEEIRNMECKDKE